MNFGIVRFGSLSGLPYTANRTFSLVHLESCSKGIDSCPDLSVSLLTHTAESSIDATIQVLNVEYLSSYYSFPTCIISHLTIYWCLFFLLLSPANYFLLTTYALTVYFWQAKPNLNYYALDVENEINHIMFHRYDNHAYVTDFLLLD